MNLSSIFLLFSKDVKSLKDSTLKKFQSKNDKSINFILGTEQNIIVFKKLC